MDITDIKTDVIKRLARGEVLRVDSLMVNIDNGIRQQLDRIPLGGPPKFIAENTPSVNATFTTDSGSTMTMKSLLDAMKLMPKAEGPTHFFQHGDTVFGFKPQGPITTTWEASPSTPSFESEMPLNMRFATECGVRVSPSPLMLIDSYSEPAPPPAPPTSPTETPAVRAGKAKQRGRMDRKVDL